MRLFHLQQKQNCLASKFYLSSSIMVLLFLQSTFTLAQNYPTTPNSLSPAVQPVMKVNKRTREIKHVHPNVRYSAEYEFYDRVQKVAKAKKRALRKLAKPQYTNAVYFGHKNIPKRHVPHKMRFCNECGIRH